MTTQVFRSWSLFWLIVAGCGLIAIAVPIAIVQGPTNPSARPQGAADDLTVAAFFALILLPHLWALRGRVRIGDDG